MIKSPYISRLETRIKLQMIEIQVSVRGSSASGAVYCCKMSPWSIKWTSLLAAWSLEAVPTYFPHVMWVTDQWDPLRCVTKVFSVSTTSSQICRYSESNRKLVLRQHNLKPPSPLTCTHVSCGWPQISAGKHLETESTPFHHNISLFQRSRPTLCRDRVPRENRTCSSWWKKFPQTCRDIWGWSRCLTPGQPARWAVICRWKW